MDRKTLAKLANVSYSTVTKALHNSSEISLETRERIHALAREYGYQDNASVRRLSKEHTGCIAMIFSRNMFYEDSWIVCGMNIQQILTREMEHFDYRYTVNVSHDVNGNSMIRYIYQQKSVDGFLFIADDIAQEDIQFLQDNHVPFVFTGVELPPYTVEVPCVLSDNYADGKLITQYLIDRGFQNIVTITDMNDKTSGYANRTKGYLDAMAQANLPTKVLHHSMQTAQTMQIMEQYLPELRKADAIYAQWDGIAGILMQLLRMQNIRVPEMVSIVGHNDYNIVKYFRPTLTTLHESHSTQGRAAISYLVNKIYNPSLAIIQKRIAGTVVERDSVMAPTEKMQT